MDFIIHGLTRAAVAADENSKKCLVHMAERLDRLNAIAEDSIARAKTMEVGAARTGLRVLGRIYLLEIVPLEEFIDQLKTLSTVVDEDDRRWLTSTAIKLNFLDVAMETLVPGGSQWLSPESAATEPGERSGEAPIELLNGPELPSMLSPLNRSHVLGEMQLPDTGAPLNLNDASEELRVLPSTAAPLDFCEDQTSTANSELVLEWLRELPTTPSLLADDPHTATHFSPFQDMAVPLREPAGLQYHGKPNGYRKRKNRKFPSCYMCNRSYYRRDELFGHIEHDHPLGKYGLRTNKTLKRSQRPIRLQPQEH